jgi:tRNA-2-methylthio-N6-dimethylallyladenosine synthase
MGRRYTREKYLELVNKLKNEIPSLALTTDIIVAFPGETEEEFNETLDIVHKCKYDSAFTFIFSPREGTPASKMIDNLDISEKNKRLYKLNDIINSYANETNQKYLGKIVKVLIEGVGEKGKLFGYTETLKLVNVIGDEDNIGRIINVEITDIKTWSMYGKIV